MLDLVVEGDFRRSAALRHLRPNAPNAPTLVDLSRMTFCEPLGLVAIASVVDHAVALGNEVIIREPNDPSRARYLSRMHVGHMLDDLQVVHSLPPVRSHDRHNTLTELAKFSTVEECDTLATLVRDTIAPMDEVRANALYEGIMESAANVLEYSGVGYGFLAAQKWNGGSDLSFAVSDSGVGLRRKLVRHNPKDDLDALLLAVKRGITSSEDPGRGLGLASIVEQLTDLGGDLEVISGTDSLRARTRKNRHVESGAPMPGTILQGFVTVRDRHR